MMLFLIMLIPVTAQVDYDSQIQPIFDDHCTMCHGNAGGLNLESYDNTLDGGNNGYVVVPGDHVSSELYIRITLPSSSDEDMPPQGSLSQDEIDLIAQWIDEGILSEISGGLIRPADGEELSYIHVFFEWEQQPDAMGYNLQASTQQFFNNLILDVDEPTTVYIDKDNFSWDNNYYWRVRPIYNDGISGPWTESLQFSIQETILLDLDVNIYNDNLIQDGLVMYSQFAPYFTVGVIDKM